MFFPERMREVNLFIYEEDIQAVTLALAQLGTVQIEDEGGAADRASSERWIALAAAYSTQERRFAELLTTLQIERSDSALPQPLNLDNNLSTLAATLHQADAAIMQWQHHQQEVKATLTRLHLMAEQLRLLAPLQIPIEEMTALQELYLTVGAMPTANLTRIQTALFRIPFTIIPALQNGTRTLVFAVTIPEHASILDRALHSAFFEPIPLPADVQGLPTHALTALTTRETALAKEQQALSDEQRQLADRWREPLTTAWQHARACHTLANAISRFPLQGQVYLIAGWTPVSALSTLTATIQAITEKRAIIEVLEPDEMRLRVPTLLRNPPLLAPFEGLVTTFGVPAYNEIDPTLLVGVTFVLMYGMMFGDIGHGALLMVAGWWLHRRRGGMAQLAPVLIIAGLSAALFGLLYGTVLGMPLFNPLWVRPLDSMTDLLLAAVGAGVIVLNLGFALQLFIAGRARDWSTFLFDKNGFVGIWLYWSLLGGGLALWLGIITANSWLLLMLVPTLLLFFHGPLAQLLAGKRPLMVESWGEYAVLAFFELFEAFIAFGGNSLSFVRLGAFAVAHEGLSQVVLLLAGQTGTVRWLLALALGTLVIVGFEGLIVGIQTLRLEYYEFFGKFFRGDGRSFTPLRIAEL